MPYHKIQAKVQFQNEIKHGHFYLLRSNLEFYRLNKAERYNENQFINIIIALLHLMASFVERLF